jgi:hypothetical protein
MNLRTALGGSEENLVEMFHRLPEAGREEMFRLIARHVFSTLPPVPQPRVVLRLVASAAAQPVKPRKRKRPRLRLVVDNTRKP